jgi:hypothetical protein
MIDVKNLEVRSELKFEVMVSLRSIPRYSKYWTQMNPDKKGSMEAWVIIHADLYLSVPIHY